MSASYSAAQTVSLLNTKVHIPPRRPDVVPRARLIAWLNDALRLGRRFVLLSAPAGYGKTTLLSEWAACCRPVVRVAWLSLDNGDNDPVRFMAYFVLALQSVDEGIGKDLLIARQAAQSRSIESMLTLLLNQLAGVSGPLVLVLDDYHLIRVQAIHDALAFLIDHMPSQMHLVVATRADPPLSLARLRGRGQLAELRLTDLRFSLEETATFLNRMLSLDLSEGEVAMLSLRTEGWIAGLQMAALAIRSLDARPGTGAAGKREALAHFVQAFTGSDRYILDYLVEEVLERQTQEVQRFLLETAILDRLTGQLCDFVRGVDGEQDRSQDVLEQLDHTNLFVVPLDNERCWYRYHRLFADLLHVRLRQTYQDQLPALHRRASIWYERNGFTEEAIEHALSAGDVDRAVDLVEHIAEEMMMRSELVTLHDWVGRLPDELVASRPALCIYHAWALLLSGHPLGGVESRLQDAIRETERLPSRVAPLQALIAFFQGRITYAAELSRHALDQLPEEDVFLRGIATLNLGMSYLVGGKRVEGSRLLEQAIRTSQQTGNVMIAVMTVCNMAELYVAQGQLHSAWEVYQRALDLATGPAGEQDQRLPISGMPLMGLGDLAREWNDLEGATRYLTAGIERIEDWGEIGAMEGYVALARVKQALGDPQGATEAMQRACRLAEKFDATDLDDAVIATHQVRLWVAQGNLRAAERWVEERMQGGDVIWSTLETADLDYHIRQRERITWARVLIAQYRPAEALPLLTSVLTSMEQRGGYSTRRVIELYVLRALACQAQGRVPDALSAVERALALGEPGGYVRIFLDEGPALLDLLQLAAENGVAPAYIDRLFAHERERQERRSPAAAPTPAFARSSETLVEPPSERELEVLQLLAQGLSNREIAHRLVLSINTVKSHTRSLYAKLGVNSRTKAVAKARDLGILAM